MKSARFKRIIVPVGSIWPQPKKSPRQRYRFSWGTKKNRRTIICSTDMETTLAMVQKTIAHLERVRTGQIDAGAKRYAEEDRRPIADHLLDWQLDLAARGCEPKHVAQMYSYARAILQGSTQAPAGRARKRGRGALQVELPSLAIDRISEIVASRVRRQIGIVKAKRSAATANRYRDAVVEFLEWGVEDTRWPRNVCSHLERFNAKADRVRIRRAIPAEQFAHLIETTEAGPINSGLSGPQRSLIYRVVCAAGLRSTEARRLPIKDAVLEGDHPGVWVDAKIGKNRKRQFVPLPLSLAAELLEAIEGRGPNEPLLAGLPSSENTGRMVERDLVRAGIDYETAEGFFDFHGLRYECGALLISAGCNVKAVQQHMRHSSIQLTLDTYGHLLPDDREHARNSLHSFDAPERKQLAKDALDRQRARSEKAQRKAQREDVPKCPSLSTFVPPSEGRKGSDMRNPPENAGLSRWSHGESNPDLLNAIQPSAPQNQRPAHNLKQLPAGPKAQSAAPTPRVRYSRHLGVTRARVIKPTSAASRRIHDFTKELVQTALAAATKERTDAGLPTPIPLKQSDQRG